MNNIGDIVGIKKDVRSYISCSLFPNNTLVGVEIEIEGCQGLQNEYTYWEVKGDGSLRGNSAEFVMKWPLFGQDIIDALKEFNNIKERSEIISKWIPSERTSVHVHVDVTDMDLVQFQRFILFYLTFEKMLFKVSGNRNNNIHCLPWNKISQISKGVNQFCKTKNLSKIKTGKYIALNTEPIWRQGSIEFRFHEGCFDSEVIITWIRILLFLKYYSGKTEIDFKAYPQEVSEMGLIDFLHDIFPEEIYRKIFYTGIEMDILEGVRFAQEALYLDKITQYNDEMVAKRNGQRVVSPLLKKYAEKHNISLETKET